MSRKKNKTIAYLSDSFCDSDDESFEYMFFDPIPIRKESPRKVKPRGEKEKKKKICQRLINIDCILCCIICSVPVSIVFFMWIIGFYLIVTGKSTLPKHMELKISFNSI